MWIGIEHGKGPATDLTYMFMKQKALYESRAYNYTDSETRHLSRLKYQRQAIKNKVSVCVWGGGGKEWGEREVGVGKELLNMCCSRLRPDHITNHKAMPKQQKKNNFQRIRV